MEDIYTKVLEDANKFWEKADFGIGCKEFKEFFESLESTDKDKIFHPEDRSFFDFSIENDDFINSVNGVGNTNDNALFPVIPQAFHIPTKNLDDIRLVVLMKNPGLDRTFIGEEAQIEEQERYRKGLIGMEEEKEGEKIFYVPWNKKEGWHYDHFKPKSNSLLEYININDNQVAQIEFFPYQSKDQSIIPKQFITSTKSKFIPLPSQEHSFNIFKYLLQNTKAIFIVRDWNRWNNLVENYLFENESNDYSNEFKKRSFVPNYPQSFYLATNRIRAMDEKYIKEVIDGLVEEIK